MIQELWGRFKAHDRRVTEFLDKQAKVESFKALMIMLTLVVAAWAFAWYVHVIGPWLDDLLGLGPHDIDSAGKIRWRHIWSTAICVPSIVVFVGLYILNIRDRIRYRNRFGTDQASLGKSLESPPSPADTTDLCTATAEADQPGPGEHLSGPPSLDEEWAKATATTTVVMHTPPAPQWKDGEATLDRRKGRVTLAITPSKKPERS